METRIETTIQQDGTLTLNDLPFHAGETVEVVVTPKSTPENVGAYPLRGTQVISPNRLSQWPPVIGKRLHDRSRYARVGLVGAWRCEASQRLHAGDR